MKKAYIIPEIQIYDADAEEILAGSPPKQTSEFEGPGTPGSGGSDENEAGGGALAKPGDFFCDNFEYELDF